MRDFEQTIADASPGGLHSAGVATIQVNVGLRCNQQCVHCHVGGSPRRTERMDSPTMGKVLDAATRLGCQQVDITGGAPELNPHLRGMVRALRRAGLGVQVRTNLTALLEPGQESTAAFFRRHEVDLVGSMPCYLEENVSAQRGRGVYRRSVEAIRRLNALGYAGPGGPALHLVYNPGGPFLPPEQSALEADYRRQLGERFGIVFSRLLTITNMPIGRFGDDLRRRGQEASYMRLLRDSFNPATVDTLMCRRQVSVAWDGALYDCDFNLALGRPVDHGAPDRIDAFDLSRLAHRRIVTGDHCFGCTAGHGSSCSGALA